MKIMIAVPCFDSVPTPFFSSMMLLDRSAGECSLVVNAGSLVYTSRNDIALRAIATEADFVFWCDSDMEFAPDTLTRLYKTLTENDYDIVTGIYCRRKPPYTPTLFDRLDIEGEVCWWSEFHEIPDEPFEVGGCGFGCVLMKTDVFLDVQGKFGNCFAPIANNGEDIAFCWRARQCGYKVYCDPSVRPKHIGQIAIDMEFYEAYRKQTEGIKNGNS